MVNIDESGASPSGLKDYIRVNTKRERIRLGRYLNKKKYEIKTVKQNKTTATNARFITFQAAQRNVAGIEKLAMSGAGRGKDQRERRKPRQTCLIPYLSRAGNQ